MKKWLFLLIFASSMAHASCGVYNSHDEPVGLPLHDPLHHLLTRARHCPVSPSEFRGLLSEEPAIVESIWIVANRGRNNPSSGSFSIIESFSGKLADGEEIPAQHFFVEYFTHASNGILQLDEKPTPNKLLLESIVWDPSKNMFNFYELRGFGGGKTRWYYRGDSRDAFEDNARLYRFPLEEPNHFGQRMRCSGCHNSGGPVMKERAPYNDWWRFDRELPLAPNVPDDKVQKLLERLSSPAQLETQVADSHRELLGSNAMRHFKQSLTLQEQLRPLFCTDEINLVSAHEEHEDLPVDVPPDFFMDELLRQENKRFQLSAADYKQQLTDFLMIFPETDRSDADHAWLTPVRSSHMTRAVIDLINQSVISERLAMAVLGVDFRQPVFSETRCRLLQLVPIEPTTDWESTFRERLKEADASAAVELLTYWEHPERLNEARQHYLKDIQQQLQTPEGKRELFMQLLMAREALAQAEMSQNPLGQILEPGFRVIFPVSRALPPYLHGPQRQWPNP